MTDMIIGFEEGNCLNLVDKIRIFGMIHITLSTLQHAGWSQDTFSCSAEA